MNKYAIKYVIDKSKVDTGDILRVDFGDGNPKNFIVTLPTTERIEGYEIIDLLDYKSSVALRNSVTCIKAEWLVEGKVEIIEVLKGNDTTKSVIERHHL